MKSMFLGVVLLAVVLSVPCFAGNQLSIRLVEVAQEGNQESGEGLEDVIAILKKSLPYANYRLVASCTIKLPAKDTRTLGEYTIKCSGPQKNLTVKVLCKDKEVLKTTNIPIKEKKPFILGGLPGKTGKLLLVFLVK